MFSATSGGKHGACYLSMALFFLALISGEPVVGEVLAELYIAILNALCSFLPKRGHDHSCYVFFVLTRYKKKITDRRRKEQPNNSSVL